MYVNINNPEYIKVKFDSTHTDRQTQLTPVPVFKL